MRVKQLSTAVLAIAFGSCTFVSHADNYWQAPNWSGFSGPSSNNNNYRRPPPPNYRQPPANYQAPNTNRAAPPPPPGPYKGAPAPRSNQYRGAPAPQPNQYRGAPAPQPNQYRGAPPPGRYSGPSAFNTPRYNPYRSNRGNRMPWGGNNNRFGNDKFWGRSGPSTWMSPSKRNWENSWDDMINAPSRMGEMPGGWTAPEVTVPNPIDMGDQVQENLQDLPEQMKDGNIGNDVSN